MLPIISRATNHSVPAPIASTPVKIPQPAAHCPRPAVGQHKAAAISCTNFVGLAGSLPPRENRSGPISGSGSLTIVGRGGGHRGRQTPPPIRQHQGPKTEKQKHTASDYKGLHSAPVAPPGMHRTPRVDATPEDDAQHNRQDQGSRAKAVHGERGGYMLGDARKSQPMVTAHPTGCRGIMNRTPRGSTSNSRQYNSAIRSIPGHEGSAPSFFNSVNSSSVTVVRTPSSTAKTITSLNTLSSRFRS